MSTSMSLAARREQKVDSDVKNELPVRRSAAVFDVNLRRFAPKCLCRQPLIAAPETSPRLPAWYRLSSTKPPSPLCPLLLAHFHLKIISSVCNCRKLFNQSFVNLVFVEKIASSGSGPDGENHRRVLSFHMRHSLLSPAPC